MGLLSEIKSCKICENHLPHPPNPILSFSSQSKILIVGQAPGRVVNEKGVPFDDKSGETLRKWLDVSREEFYDTNNFGIVPMGFCYPGKGKSGDLPPRKECAETWHEKVLEEIRSPKMIILIGAYAQKYYLSKTMKRNLTETVRDFHLYLPKFFPIVHPSGLNFRWQAKNPWFVEEIIPILKYEVKKILKP
ncbi:MAG: uracil-DNA glycosylase family protein [Crocinitomicaceae bacterium]